MKYIQIFMINVSLNKSVSTKFESPKIACRRLLEISVRLVTVHHVVNEGSISSMESTFLKRKLCDIILLFSQKVDPFQLKLAQFTFIVTF